LQEEVENRTVSLAIRSSKLTADVLKKAITKYLAYRKEKSKAKAVMKPTGKQTVKELIGQNQGVSNIEITEKNIKGFDRVARKYGVDYAVKKDTSGEIPKYLVFFKARDADALTAAFTEFASKEKNREKPSVIKHLRDLKAPEIAKDAQRVRHKEKGLEL
jgi:hypothetical protein